jgi:LysM repeat protein
MRQGGRRAVAAVVLAAFLLVAPHNWPARVRGWAGTMLGRRRLGLGAVVVLAAALATAGVASGSGHGETGAPPALAADGGDADPAATMLEPPAVGDPTSAAPAAPAAPTRPLVSVLKYTVQPGDTLRTIAERFGVTVSELIAGNQLADPDALAVGQALAIPRR